MRMTGKSRMPHANNAITTPVLHYTSAVQRNDLYSHAASTNDTQASHEAMSLWDFQRPRTSDGRPRNKKQPRLRIKIPPLDAVSTPLHTGDENNGNTIGIALGSPRMVDRRHGIPQLRQQDPFRAHTEKPRQPPIQRKPSKWRKIGGLFRAKTATTSTPNRPSYKVRNNNPPQASCHSIDFQSHTEAGRKPNSLSPGDENQDSKPRTQAARGFCESKAGDTMPFLEVEIPDTHLERYSVMFGGLPGQGKPALLSRRSKTTDSMASSNKEPSIPSPKSQRPRRATSPTRSKSPSFTLFPTMQTSKASRLLGTANIPRGPSPLQRSQTLPTDQEQEYLTSDTYSPSLKAPMSPRPSRVPTPIDSNRHLAQIIEKLDNNADKQDKPSSTHGHEQNVPVHLEINTKDPSPHSIYNESTASSPLISPFDAARDKIDQILTPTNPKTPASGTESALIDDEDTINANSGDAPQPSPKFEISVARSVSVSKSKKKQVVVPVRPKADRLLSDDRLIGKRPQFMDVHYGHRHGNSHDVRIESV